MTTPFSVGDYVYVGPPRPLKTTWQITSLHEISEGSLLAFVKSGQSGRTRFVPVDRLQLHSRGVAQ